MIFLTFGQQSILTITTLMAQFMLFQDYRVKKYIVIETSFSVKGSRSDPRVASKT